MMNVKFVKTHSCETVDASVVVVFSDYDEVMIPEELKAELKVLEEREAFDIKKGGLRRFNLNGKAFYICAVDKASDKAVLDDLRFSVYKLYKEVMAERFESVSISLQSSALSKAYAYLVLAEHASLSQYKFDKFKSSKKETVFEHLYIVDADANVALEEAVKEGLLLAEAQKTTKELVNEPANKMFPEDLAEKAKECGKKYGFDVDVYEKDKIQKLGMDAYWSVAKGSPNHPPKLIVMRYRGGDKNAKNYGLVGKGLCFDSGGYSLKPSTGMDTMKLDMGGAATLIGAMQAIATAKLPVNITAVVASCQNLIGTDAYLPGDIIGSMAGKSIFVKNTDAEGRLTLVDAITYIIREEKVDTVIDFATLTGAAMAAFGAACAATMTNDDEFYKTFKDAADKAGEKVWLMPIFDEYKSIIKHEDADLNNCPGNPGIITAGMFLGEFVEDKPWVHVDIAPTAYIDKQSGFYDKGATGYGVKICYEFAKSQI